MAEQILNQALAVLDGHPLGEVATAIMDAQVEVATLRVLEHGENIDIPIPPLTGPTDRSSEEEAIRVIGAGCMVMIRNLPEQTEEDQQITTILIMYLQLKFHFIISDERIAFYLNNPNALDIYLAQRKVARKRIESHIKSGAIKLPITLNQANNIEYSRFRYDTMRPHMVAADLLRAYPINLDQLAHYLPIERNTLDQYLAGDYPLALSTIRKLLRKLGVQNRQVLARFLPANGFAYKA